jgi:hypothetical protein
VLAQFPRAKIHLEDAESEPPRKMLSLWHGEKPTAREFITTKPTRGQLDATPVSTTACPGTHFPLKEDWLSIVVFPQSLQSLTHELVQRFRIFLAIERELTELEDLQERPSMKSVRFLDSPHETLGKEIVLIQKCLREHQSEVTVGIYDIAVFKAIDEVRARPQKADKDLETIRSELSYKEYQAKSGG